MRPICPLCRGEIGDRELMTFVLVLEDDGEAQYMAHADCHATLTIVPTPN